MLTKTLATRYPFATLTTLTARNVGWLLIAYPTVILWVWLAAKIDLLPWWTPIAKQTCFQLGLRIAAWKNKRLPARIITFQRWCRFRRKLPALLASIVGDTNPAYLIAAAPGSARTTTAVANRLRPIGISPKLGRITRITPQAVTCVIRPAKGKTLDDFAELSDSIAASDQNIHSIDVDYRRRTTTKGKLTVYFGEPFNNTVSIHQQTQPQESAPTDRPRLSLVADSERKPA